MSVSKDFAEIINAANKKGTQPYTSKATVMRVESQTAYVNLDDGVPETPVALSINAKPGDEVLVRIANSGGYIIGNTTAPPTDDSEVKAATEVIQRTISKVVDDFAEVQLDVSEINESIEAGEFTTEYVAIEYCLSTSNAEFIPYQGMTWSESLPSYVTGCYYWTRTATHYEDGSVYYSEPIFSQADQLAAETKIALDSTNNHFWFDNSGAYVTEEEGTYATGYATRITNAGILQSYNGNLMSSWTNSGVTFYKSDGQTPLASYGSGGISFASDVPFTIGSASSYIKWIQENGTWKIKICADAIEMGGSSVLVDGDAGQWYSGTGITGTSATATIFPNSGVATAKVGDMYLNTSTSNTYRCTVAGAPSTARWVYVNNIKGADGQDGEDGADGIDVTSQYMSFDSSNGLRVYSGYKGNTTYNKTYVGIKTSGMSFYVNSELRAQYLSTGATFYFTDWYGDDASLTMGVINDEDGDASAGLSTSSYSLVIDPDDRVYLQGNLSGTGWIYMTGDIETGSRFRSLKTYNDRGTGTTAGLYVNSNGTIMRIAASSSRRYKEDIGPVDTSKFNIHGLYDVPIRQFRFKQGYFYEDAPESAYDLRVGLIAEELYEHYPAAVEFEENGEIETWSDRNIIPPMLALIQEQKTMIDDLQERIETLERRSA